MILLVPVSPEVPKYHRPRLWQSITLVLVVSIIFLEILPTLEADTNYIDNLQNYLPSLSTDRKELEKQANAYLKHRPLLKYSPARGDWDLKRLLLANFIHGSIPHLLLNLIGIFAGVRICSTFLPFLCVLSIFILGGSLGLFTSMLTTSQFSDFIPHVGASSGIFALMGSYYIYNFRFRTTYFFWFPSHRGLISFKTSWFFFVDVVLLELVLSTAQLFPDRIDAVDHIAHVVGFFSGAVLALCLRTIQRWPSFLQTRGEFLYWINFIVPKLPRGRGTDFHWLMEMLEINRYNDRLKLKLLETIAREHTAISDEELSTAFKNFRPTFVRLYTPAVANCFRVLLKAKRKIPSKWLSKSPYDTVIRIAKVLATPVEEQRYLLEFVLDYRKNQKEGGDIDRKLEVLTLRLQSAIDLSAQVEQKSQDEMNGSSSLDKSPPTAEQPPPKGTAKRAS